DSLALLALAAATRMVLGSAASRAFGAPARAPLALAALSDALGLATWAAAFVGRRVDWSGLALDISRDGSLANGATPLTILVPQGAEALAVRLGARGAAAVIAIPPGAAPPRDLVRRAAAGRARLVVMGLCGALDPSLHVGDVVAYRSVGDEALRFACEPAPIARTVHAFTSSHVVTTVAERRRLAQRSGAAVVDMEGTWIAMALAARGLRCATVRVVGDAATRDLPPLAAAVQGGRVDARVVAGAFLRDPQAAVAFSRDALVALAALARAARTLATASP
ncbi:MAG: hypothetical protein JOZ24_07705, partial [Candidatus Eremiobacteraeota bacterium]|nr:hypothetical protein [Candidatus Eremiobacteraeota bacterium]